jgi:hypothetical protein
MDANYLRVLELPISTIQPKRAFYYSFDLTINKL